MKRGARYFLIVLIAIALLRADRGMFAAQYVPGQIDVEPVQISPPTYPPLARTARISGDVKLELQLRPDGTVWSVRAISGSPLLVPAAADSAKASRFTCFQCALPATYVLTYTFGFRQDGECNAVKVGSRSPKCLYLWKCRTWYEDRPIRPPVIIQSKDRITLGADTACWEPEYTASQRNQR